MSKDTIHVFNNLNIKGVIANGEIGTAGQVLHSNGTATYWAIDENAGGSVTSVATANGLSGGPITTTGTLGVVSGSTLTVNVSGIHVNTANLSIATSQLTGDVALGANTSGNYVATIAAGNGISGSSSTEGGTPTIAVVAGLGIASNSTGVHVVVGNSTVISNTLGVYVNAAALSIATSQLTGDVALGTNTSGNYVATITNANGISGSSSAEGGTPTIGVVTGSSLTVNTTGIHVNSALSITDLALSGNLTVSGTRTYINTTTLEVGDNIVTLNADLGANPPTENAGIEIMRGTSANAQFIWDETNDRWSTNGQPIAISSLVAAGAASGITTLAAGNTTITGFANVGTSLQVGTGTYGEVVTTQFASVFGTGTGPNPYSIMQVRSNDGTTGMGMQAYAGLYSKIYTSNGFVFTTGATIRDKDYPTGGTTRATLDSTGLTVTGIANVSSTLAAGNTTITGFANVTGTIQSGSSLTIAGAASGITTLAAGNTTITGFANVAGTITSTSTSGIRVEANDAQYRLTTAGGQGWRIGTTSTSTTHGKFYIQGSIDGFVSSFINAIDINTSGGVVLASTVSGITTLAAGNTTITGFANVAGNILSRNLLMQGDNTNAYIRPTNTPSNLYLGANNTNIVTIFANGNLTTSSSLTVAGPVSGITTLASGNTTITGFASATTEMRSPIFKDSDNTLYYIDPASTSVVNVVVLDATGAIGHVDRGRDVNTVTLPNWLGLSTRWDFVNSGNAGTGGNYAGVMTFAPWLGTTASTGDASYQLVFGSTAVNGSGVPQLRIRNGIDTTWNSFYNIHHDGFATMYATSSFRAPMFKDSDNDAYYGDFAGTSVLNAAIINGTRASFVLGSLGVGTTVRLLSIEGNYDTGQFAHRFRKEDLGGGVPLSLDYSMGTAGSYTQLVQWGPYTGDGGYLIRHQANTHIAGNLMVKRDANSTNVGDSASIVLSNRNTSINGGIMGGIFADTFRDVADPHYSAGMWFTRVQQATNLSSSSEIVFGTMISGSSTALPTERMRINTAGNVGIGTIAPGTKLEISSTSAGATAEVLRLNNPGAGVNTAAQIKFFAAGTNYATITGGYGAAAPQMTFNMPTASAGNYVWQGNSVEQMRLDSSGNLGIGTTSNLASNKLVVYGDISTDWALGTTQIGMKYIDGTNYYLGMKLIDSDRSTHIISKAADGTGYIAFDTGATPTERLRINTAGNIIAAVDMRAPIFYDSNNTAYYLDPASTSTSLNAAGNITTAGGVISLANGTSNRIAWNNNGVNPPAFTTYSTGVKLILYDSIGASSTGYTIGINNSTMFFTAGTTGDGFKWYAATTNFMSSNTTGLTHTGTITASSLYATIYYDSDNTAYYTDPNTTSNLYGLTVNQVITGSVTGYSTYLPTRYDSGQKTNPQTYFGQSIGLRVAMTAMPVVWADTLWINGYAGGDVLDMCALHFSRQGTPKMWISTQQSTATSYGTFYELPSFGYNSGNTGDLYAGIFKDSNDTAYYVDPNSTTNLLGLTVTNTITGSVSGTAASAGRLYTNTGTNNSSLQYWQLVDNATLNPDAGYYYGLRMGHGDADTYYNATLVASFFADNLYMRRKVGGTDQTWRRFWHNGDSSITASADFRAPIFYDTTNTAYYWNFASSAVSNIDTQITGFAYFLSNRNTTSNSPPLQCYSNDAAQGAIMSFHRSGIYAINMGLDSDNIFRIAGWSAAANAFQMDGSGNLTMLGNVTAYSDVRKKKDITTIENALDMVTRMRGVRFRRIDTDQLGVGVIAQEMLEVLPEVVQQGIGDDDTMSVAYGNIVGVLIEAIKEQQAHINKLETKINSLEQRLI